MIYCKKHGSPHHPHPPPQVPHISDQISPLTRTETGATPEYSGLHTPTNLHPSEDDLAGSVLPLLTAAAALRLGGSLDGGRRGPPGRTWAVPAT